MWEMSFFEDFIELQRGFDLPEHTREEGEYPVIASTSVVGYHNQYRVLAPCVVTGRSGSLGFVQFIEKPCFPLNTTLYVKDFKGNHPRFVYYFLQTLRLEQYNSGAGVPTLNRNDLDKLKIRIPPPPIQQRIAEVLGRYDDLIENYQQQIEILEALAQSLYREWFARERCPYAHYEEGAKLPVDWDEKCLDDIARETRRIVRVGNLEPSTPYVGLEHLSIKSIIIRDWGTAEDVDSDKLAFEKNNILFGKIRPYLHKVCLSHFDGVCSSDAIVITPTVENALSFVLFTVFDEKFIDFADRISNGTKMPRAEWSVLQTYKVVVPSDEVLAVFENLVSPILSKLENIQSQITKLRQMRDKLLPRLMSGQIPLEVSA